jgi:probable HAF family extracellular repeat protein
MPTKRVQQIICAAIAAALVSIALAPAPAAAATFHGLGHLRAGDASAVYGVSADGSVVFGASFSDSSSSFFRWTSADGLRALNELPAGGFPRAGIWDVSGDGSTIVGDIIAPSEDRTDAYRWTSMGGIEKLGRLPGGPFRSIATGVSADGSVVVGKGVRVGYEAFRWTSGGGMQGLGYLRAGDNYSAAWGVNGDGSIVVGEGGNDMAREAFRWTSAGGMQGLGHLRMDHKYSSASAISADGTTIVGVSIDNPIDEVGEAFRWTREGGMQGLGFLPGGEFIYSGASGVSGDGSIVVGISSSSSSTAMGHEPFLWDSAHGMRSLQQVLVSDYGLDLTGWTLSNALISANGRTLVGNGINPLGQYEAWIATIPEPTSAALFGLVATFLFTMRRRSHDSVTNPFLYSSEETVLPTQQAGSMICVAVCALAIACGPSVAAAASFRGLGHLPGSNYTVARGVSNDGSVIVGSARSGSQNYEAFRWTNTDGMQGLGFLPNHRGSYAYGVSGDGSTIIGGSFINSDASQPFRWTTAEGMQRLAGFSAQIFSDAEVTWGGGIAISADGSTIVSASGPIAFRWTSTRELERVRFPSGVTVSSANAFSADGSVFVGSYSSSVNGAFRWTSDGGFQDLGISAAEFNPSAFAASTDGSVIVGSNGAYAFRWTAEGTQILGDPRFYSVAMDVSGDGSILVGISEDLGAFIWDAARSIRSLQHVLTTDYGLDLTGWKLQGATAISADGRTIVGYGTHSGRTEAWVATIPEPSSLAQLALGVTYLLVLRQRLAGQTAIRSFN